MAHSLTFRIMLAFALLCVAGLPLFGQGTGYLVAKVDPGRAGVFVDGKYIGPAQNFGMARKYSIAAGDHEIKLADPRYEDMTTKVHIDANKTTKITPALKALPVATPPFGLLHVKATDKYSAVYLNNKYYGHAGEFNNCAQGLLLPPGSYEVRVEPLSGKPHTEKVAIAADKTVVVDATK